MPLARHRVRRLEYLAGLQPKDRLLTVRGQEIEQNFYFSELDERHEAIASGAFRERSSPAPRMAHALASDDELSKCQDMLIAQWVDGFHERVSDDTADCRRHARRTPQRGGPERSHTLCVWARFRRLWTAETGVVR